jgi:glycosyltransferase involved in cell wall biosynthesis
MAKAMNLAVFSGQYFYFDGIHYSTDEAFVKFVTSFYPCFEKIIFCDAVINAYEKKAYVLDDRKTEVCPLPYFSVYSFVKNVVLTFPRIYRAIRGQVGNWDVVWLPAPHPVSLLFAFVCHRRHKPFFLMVRQNLLEQVRHRNREMRRWAAMAVVATLELIFHRLARRHLTFTVGKEMYEAYSGKESRVFQVAVSLISNKDIEDSSSMATINLHGPIRLLSVGRLDPEKGLLHLIAAVEELIAERHLAVVLRIVGKGLAGSEEARLRQEVQRRQLTDCIVFLGYCSHGEELFRLYRESDIFILPSLTGEGIPQTLFEAMACGIPVIATRVAGIPSVIVNGDNGLLVSPGSSRQICEAIECLAKDDELRGRLIRRGFEIARRHTLDIERDRMISRVEELLDDILIDKECVGETEV